MNDRVTRYYTRFQAILTFFASRLADFAPPSAVPGYLAQLKAVVQKMRDLGADKIGGGDAGKTGMIEALRTDMSNIHRTAVALDPTNPGLAAKFPLPEHSDRGVIDTAGAYLKALAPQPENTAAQSTAKTALVQLFLAHEFPSDFVSHLQSDFAAVDPAAEAQRARRQDQVKDTEALETQIKLGNPLVLLLNAAAHNKYTRDAATLRAWQSASHLERAPKRTKKDTQPNEQESSSGNATPGDKK